MGVASFCIAVTGPSISSDPDLFQIAKREIQFDSCQLLLSTHLLHAATHSSSCFGDLQTLNTIKSSSLCWDCPPCCLELCYFRVIRPFVTATFPLHKLNIQYGVDSKEGRYMSEAFLLQHWSSITNRETTLSWSMTWLLPPLHLSHPPPPHAGWAIVWWHSGEHFWVCCLHKSLISFKEDCLWWWANLSIDLLRLLLAGEQLPGIYKEASYRLRNEISCLFV